MRKDLTLVRNMWTHTLLAAGGLLLLGKAPLAAGPGEAAATDNYTWSAELVAFDRASRAATLKARIENHADIPHLSEINAGDRVTLTWTGRSWGAGVRDIARAPRATGEGLMLPVEFVSTEMDGRYVTFRVEVPADAAAGIAALAPGAWVTGTSPRQISASSEAVHAIRPYSDAS